MAGSTILKVRETKILRKNSAISNPRDAGVGGLALFEGWSLETWNSVHTIPCTTPKNVDFLKTSKIAVSRRFSHILWFPCCLLFRVISHYLHYIFSFLVFVSQRQCFKNFRNSQGRLPPIFTYQKSISHL